MYHIEKNNFLMGIGALEVKKATTAHVDELAMLFNEYRMFYKKTSDFEKAKLFLHERLKRNESEIFVSFCGTTMTGFIQLYPLFSSVRMKNLWVLNDLYVHEKFRGQGISISLIDRAKALCRESGACGFMLETAKANVVGNRLYQKVGLTEDREYVVYTWEV
jgi:GNAT superfamily N-acetyltransferase